MSMLSLALKNSRARLFAQPSFTSQIAKFSSAQAQLQASGATNPADPEYRSGNDRYHEYGQYLMSLMPKYVQQFTVYKDELTLHVAPSGLIPACRILRDHSGCQFKQLVDIAGVDFPHRNNRFELVYNFLSIVNSTRIKVKTYADEVSPVPSLSDLFKSSIWFEREVYDMYGVFFTNHPDLRRILTDYGFMGYPLRKDFPLTGYVEVRYDEERKRVVTEPLELAQAFRSFDYSSAWEQTGPGRPDFPKSLPKQEKTEN